MAPRSPENVDPRLNFPTDCPEIDYEIVNEIAIVTLNRPDALNALSAEMVRALSGLLDAWGPDPGVYGVILQGKGRAFCAGGDIRAGYHTMVQGAWDHMSAYFQAEYALNAQVQRFPKPYISLLDGITMGGGMGISIHGSHRLVTENAKLGMPETRIGFFPDVGSASFLNQAPGGVGMYLALAGKSVTAADALYTGLATHFLPRERMKQLIDDLTRICFENAQTFLPHVALCLEKNCREPEHPAALPDHQDLINRCFQKTSVEEIIDALKVEEGDFAEETLKILQEVSPHSLRATFDHFVECRGLPFETIIEKDFALSQELMIFPDFQEGIRAALIDKDKTPRWSN